MDNLRVLTVLGAFNHGGGQSTPAAPAAPKEPVSIHDAEGKIKDGYRYMLTPQQDDCNVVNIGNIGVCQYAQAELWVDNRSSALEVYYP